MRAVVECAVYDAPPPAELRLAWQCQRWQTLPEDGNLLAQDFVTMHRMNLYTNIYNSIVRIYSLKGKDIHKLTEHERTILKMLMDEGLLFNG